MTWLAPALRRWLEAGEQVILVEVASALGSTPREAGASMLVSLGATHGTIGGGQLEFHAIDVAREMIGAQAKRRTIDLSLGPFLGQCCGGRVELVLERADAEALARLAAAEDREAGLQAQVLLFGAGHVGLALARALAPLPLTTTLIDDRDAPPPAMPTEVRFAHADDPETLIAAARAGAAYVVLTHSHALDYRLADAALRRTDAAYVGMIGSATKRARFEHWFKARGGTQAELSRFICPIGGKATRDKRPEVIAALAAAEILGHVLASDNAGVRSRSIEREAMRGPGARVGAKIDRSDRAA